MAQFHGSTPIPVILQGYVGSENNPTPVEVNASGQLAVSSTGGGASAPNVRKTASVTTDGSSALVAAFATRRKLVIRNVGSENVYIGYDADMVATVSADADGALLLEPGDVYVEEDYVGAIHAATASSTSVVSIVEM